VQKHGIADRLLVFLKFGEKAPDLWIGFAKRDQVVRFKLQFAHVPFFIDSLPRFNVNALLDDIKNNLRCPSLPDADPQTGQAPGEGADGAAKNQTVS
jgi:hypothetical protein